MVQNVVKKWSRTQTTNNSAESQKWISQIRIPTKYEATESCMRRAQPWVNNGFVSWIEIEQDVVQNVVSKWSGLGLRTTALILENGFCK
jgi:hypothetical protein